VIRGGRQTRAPRGISLVEVMVAVGVLALVVPVTLAAIAAATESAHRARAETRAPLIAERVLDEIKAARLAETELLPRLEAGVDFPPQGEVLALAFDREGSAVAAVDGAAYQEGSEELEGEEVAYLATLAGVSEAPESSGLRVTVTIEHPARRRAGDRDRLTFTTKLP